MAKAKKTAITFGGFLAMTCSSGSAEQPQVSVVDSDCSLEAAKPIAIAATAWEVRKGIPANDRLNITALMTSRKVLVLGSKAVARVLGNDQANYAQEIRVLAPLGEGAVVDSCATRT